jgi:sucrose-6-phosphate hydrolase SacC (GH32 family)
MPYHEALRPRFHFTARTNWLNDPNGLVYFGGEYHLFFQHNPSGNEWGNMTWGHAVSPDLVHWRQLEDALKPDAMGTMFSGSAVVDRDNTAGFQAGREPALVAVYTAAGDTSPQSKGKPFTQCIAYSNDRGRTWTKYAKNPALPNVAAGNRDPKVVWHAPSRRWIMALYKERSDFALFSSPDLKTWLHLQDLTIPGSDECPDFFEINLNGDATKPRWVFTTANGRYLVGTFDGQRFTPEAGPYPGDFGGNYYAVQSYSDAPDGRRIQIAWMRGGKYPRMPFNQQMSFPCEVTLRTTPEGPRLFRWPVRGIESLYLAAPRNVNAPIGAGRADPLADLTGDCFDLTANLVPPRGEEGEITLLVYGHPLTYRAATHELTFLKTSMPLRPGPDGHVPVRLLVDRTSLEVFAGEGLSIMSCCFVPKPGAPPLALDAEGGAAGVKLLSVHPLTSAWD